jgi:hypothetical protein
MKFIPRGDYVELPIRSHTVCEVRLRHFSLPTLIFAEPGCGRATAHLDFHAVILTLSRGGIEDTLLWNEKSYSAESLKFYVELVGSTVESALAHKRGSLHMEFNGGFSLTAVPDVWEGWHFQYEQLYLHGDAGRLI